MSGAFQNGFPSSNTPVVDPKTGLMTKPWLQLLVAVWNRTGGGPGSSTQIAQLVDLMGSDDEAAPSQDWLVIDEPVDDYSVDRLPDIMETDDASTPAAEMLQATTIEDDRAEVDLFTPSLLITDEAFNPQDQDALNAWLLALDNDYDPSPSLPLGYTSGGFYPAYDGNVGATGPVGAVDMIYLYPFYIAEDFQAASLFLKVVTAGAGSSAKAGVWASRAGRPVGTPFLVDNTGVSTASTGPAIFSIVPSVVRRGWYWWGTKFTGTLPVCTNIVGTGLLMASRIGCTTASAAIGNGATNQASGKSFADAYANNMPDLTGATLNDVITAASGIPVLGFAVA